MMQASISPPSVENCEALLRSMPAFTQFRRHVYRSAPVEARGWLGALSMIARHDGLRASQLAELLHVDISVASRVASQLEELHYVSRAQDPDDGRARLLHATDAGREWLRQFTARFAVGLRDSLRDWTDDDVTTLAALLNRFDRSLQETHA